MEHPINGSIRLTVAETDNKYLELNENLCCVQYKHLYTVP